MGGAEDGRVWAEGRRVWAEGRRVRLRERLRERLRMGVCWLRVER